MSTLTEHLAVPTVEEAVRTALLTPLPEGTPDTAEARLVAQVEAIVRTLTGWGYLVPVVQAPVDTVPTTADIEQCAQWLAAESRHPRFGGATGWTRLMPGTGNEPTQVDMAYKAAIALVGVGEAEKSRTLAAARDELLGAHRRASAS